MTQPCSRRIDLNGTEAPDTAQRCAQTTATVVAGDSENNVSPDRIASPFSGLHEVTTCCETLALNGTNVKADDLVVQLVISKTIEDARGVRHSTEGELTNPALCWTSSSRNLGDVNCLQVRREGLHTFLADKLSGESLASSKRNSPRCSRTSDRSWGMACRFGRIQMTASVQPFDATPF